MRRELWRSTVPWKRIEVAPPLVVRRDTVSGLVVHPDGGFGWRSGDWVSGRKWDRRWHRGIDVIGWVDRSGSPRRLSDASWCCAPCRGRVVFVGKDEDEVPSVLLRHSTDGPDRVRVTFFGDLGRVIVNDGDEVSPGDRIGIPGRTPNGMRFFHFSIGYRVRMQRREVERFLDPGKLLPIPIVEKAL